ncbi:hypothetical protein GQ600_7045 [Phytophthora cactorum]|nr:hypothetical protein GQ600_7045 [Phytophthora cactorum]
MNTSPVRSYTMNVTVAMSTAMPAAIHILSCLACHSSAFSLFLTSAISAVIAIYGNMGADENALATY